MTESTGRDRVVLVTGGSRGIGLGIARVCLRRGWRVAVGATTAENAAAACDRLAAGESAPRDRLHPLALRVEDAAAWAPALDSVETALGPVSALIANAGVAPRIDGRRIAFGEEGDEEMWRRTFAVNVEGAVHGARMVARRLIAHGEPGAVVVLASIVALTAPKFVSAYYASSKAALLGFVRQAAHDLGPHGIRINAVDPGRIESDMAQLAGPGVNEAIARETSLGRLGRPEEIGEAAEFLISDRASFVTGTRLNVTGGWLEA